MKKYKDKAVGYHHGDAVMYLDAIEHPNVSDREATRRLLSECCDRKSPDAENTHQQSDAPFRQTIWSGEEPKPVFFT